MSSRLSSYDLVIGIQFKDKTETKIAKSVKGNLVSEMAQWLVNFLDNGKAFKEVVNLNENEAKDVDVILAGIIESIRVEEPGISGDSIALAFVSIVALVFEHYAVPKVIDSSATVNFQLIEPKTYEPLWSKLITETVSDKIRLSQSNKLIFTSVTKTVEALLTDTDLSEALTKMGQNQLPLPAIAAQ